MLDEDGQRFVQGPSSGFAGTVGMIDIMYGLGLRFLALGHHTPFMVSSSLVPLASVAVGDDTSEQHIELQDRGISRVMWWSGNETMRTIIRRQQKSHIDMH